MPGQNRAGAPPRRGSGMEVDWGSVPDSPGLPDGTYNVRVDQLYEGTVGQGGKVAWIGKFKVMPHKAIAKRWYGKTQNNNFVIGSDDDPQALSKDTVRDAMGTSMLKRMFKAAGVKLEPKIATSAKNSLGKVLTIEVKKNGQFVNINGWYKLGEREPEMTGRPGSDDVEDLEEETASGAEAEAEDEDEYADEDEAPKAAAAKKKKKPAEDEDEDQDEEASDEAEEDEPAPASKKKKKPADDDEDSDEESSAAGDEDSDDEEPAPKAAKKASANGKGQLSAAIPCGMCNRMIKRDKYAKHVEKCDGEPATA